MFIGKLIANGFLREEAGDGGRKWRRWPGKPDGWYRK